MDSEYPPCSVGSKAHLTEMCRATRRLWPQIRAGDLYAASSLWGAYDDERRGWLTAICIRRVVDGRMGRSVGALLLQSTWQREAAALRLFMEDDEIVHAMQMLAPGKLRRGRSIRVFRGISETDDPESAVAGMAWTTSARTAAFFARRFEDPNPENVSCVFEAHVPSEYVLGRFTERREQEVLVHPDFFVGAEANGLLRVEGRNAAIRSWSGFAIEPAELSRWDALAARYRRAMKRD